MTDLQKHTLNLRAGDWDAISARYARTGNSTSTVIRELVSAFVDSITADDKSENIKVEIEL
jgi:hypothetical protein